MLAAIPESSPPMPFLYDDADPAVTKLEKIATKIYGADGVDLTETAQARLAQFEKAGLAGLPICMAKTQNSLSDDPAKLGRPSGFRITVRDFEISNGAGFLVALTGTMMRMPALPKVPAAERIEVDAEGVISGI